MIILYIHSMYGIYIRECVRIPRGYLTRLILTTVLPVDDLGVGPEAVVHAVGGLDPYAQRHLPAVPEVPDGVRRRPLVPHDHYLADA